MKIYVVLKRNYEYNDQTYDRTEGGNVVIGFKTLEKAQDYATKETVDFIRTHGLYYYYDQYFTYSESLVEIFTKYGEYPPKIDTGYNGRKLINLDYDQIESLRTSEMTDDELEIIADALQHEMFYVSEMEMGK